VAPDLSLRYALKIPAGSGLDTSSPRSTSFPLLGATSSAWTSQQSEPGRSGSGISRRPEIRCLLLSSMKRSSPVQRMRRAECDGSEGSAANSSSVGTGSSASSRTERPRSTREPRLRAVMR
jgi:hypothetical protein